MTPQGIDPRDPRSDPRSDPAFSKYYHHHITTGVPRPVPVSPRRGFGYWVGVMVFVVLSVLTLVGGVGAIGYVWKWATLQWQ